MKPFLIALVSLVLFSQTATSQAFRQQVPGTVYTASLPPAFARSASEEKLEDTERQSSFFMIAAPVPFEKMKSFFDGENLSKRGINLVITENTTFNGKPALYLKTLQLQETGEVASLVLLFHDGKETLITTASYPASQPALEAVMKTALFSVRRNQ